MSLYDFFFRVLRQSLLMYPELASNPGLFSCLGCPSAEITGMCHQAQWKFPLIKVAVMCGYIEEMGKFRTKVNDTMNQANGGQTQIEPN